MWELQNIPGILQSQHYTSMGHSNTEKLWMILLNFVFVQQNSTCEGQEIKHYVFQTEYSQVM